MAIEPFKLELMLLMLVLRLATDPLNTVLRLVTVALNPFTPVLTLLLKSFNATFMEALLLLTLLTLTVRAASKLLRLELRLPRVELMLEELVFRTVRD
jgi:hypothetical protein